MLPSNRFILQEMLADPRHRQFAFDLAEKLKKDPHYSFRKQWRILENAARGERIVRFEDRYVISSMVPPVPSRAFLTFVQAGLDPQQPLTDLAYVRRSAPLSVHLCITARCPYRCEHCGATVPDWESELSKDDWLRILGQLQDLGVACLVFSGGEPLVRKDMEELIAAVDDRSTTLLFTNGSLLTPERARSLKQSGLFALAVSLDSPHPEEHNRLRRTPRAFDDALAAIRHASEAGLYTLVSAVVYQRDLNEANIVQLAKLVKAHGAHELRIHQPLPRGRLTNPVESAGILYTPADRARLFRIQIKLNQSTDGLPKVSSYPYTEGPCKFGCGAGVLHSYISATGDLWPCDFIPLSFGNVLKEGVETPYRRMIHAAGTPRNVCLARSLAGEFDDKPLPLNTEKAIELYRKHPSRSYPYFFKSLQGR